MQKWEREIRKEKKRRSKFETTFKIIKISSNSNARFTTYFDTYKVKINNYPVDPVSVFQKAMTMTINESGLVTGDKIWLIVSHITWTKPFSTKSRK